jgi:hypothetical protein
LYNLSWGLNLFQASRDERLRTLRWKLLGDGHVQEEGDGFCLWCIHFRLCGQLFAFGAFISGFAASGVLLRQPAVPQAVAEPAPAHVKTEAIIMLQNDALLTRRVHSVEEAGLFLKGVREVFGRAYAGNDTPETISAVVAMKPGRKAKLWLVSSLKQQQPDRTALMASFNALAVPEVQEGPVAFVIRFTVGGAAMENIPLMPPEWTAAFGDKPAIMPDAITTYLWTD